MTIIGDELTKIRQEYIKNGEQTTYYPINCNILVRDGRLIQKIAEMYESNKSEVVRLLVAKGMKVFLSENPMVTEPLYLEIECPFCSVKLMNMNNHPFGQFLENNIAKCPKCNKLYEKDKLEVSIIDLE